MVMTKCAENCEKCAELVNSRRQIVWGDGDYQARVMVIAEAPGVEEDRQGRPMVGTGGQEARHHLAINGIATMGLYITNILKCHPPGNRDPKAQEISNCLEYLKLEIKDIDPDYIITMGKFATQTVLGDSSMEMIHGIPRIWGNKVVIPTYHPAAGLHDPNLMIMFHADMKIAGAVCRG